MCRRRAALALFIVAGLAFSATSASAGSPRATVPKTPVVLERPITTVDGSITSLILFFRDRLVIAYRNVVDVPGVGTGNKIDGIDQGPDNVDPLGNKDRGLHGAVPAKNRIPGI